MSCPHSSAQAFYLGSCNPSLSLAFSLSLFTCLLLQTRNNGLLRRDPALKLPLMQVEDLTAFHSALLLIIWTCPTAGNHLSHVVVWKEMSDFNKSYKTSNISNETCITVLKVVLCLSDIAVVHSKTALVLLVSDWNYITLKQGQVIKPVHR